MERMAMYQRASPRWAAGSSAPRLQRWAMSDSIELKSHRMAANADEQMLTRVCIILSSLLLLGIWLISNSGHAANLVARWKFNEANPPYSDSGPNGIALRLDSATS